MIDSQPDVTDLEESVQCRKTGRDRVTRGSHCLRLALECERLGALDQSWHGCNRLAAAQSAPHDISAGSRAKRKGICSARTADGDLTHEWLRNTTNLSWGGKRKPRVIETGPSATILMSKANAPTADGDKRCTHRKA